MEINTISAKTTPISKTKAALKPFKALVSNKTKKTGPTIKLKKMPNGIPDKISSIIINF